MLLLTKRCVVAIVGLPLLAWVLKPNTKSAQVVASSWKSLIG